MSFLGLRRGLLLDRPGEYQGNGAPSVSTLSKGKYRRGARYWDLIGKAFYICDTAGTETTATWTHIGAAGATGTFWARIATHDTAGAEASFTWSGLSGDSDLEYLIVGRWVKVSAADVVLMVRPNNDATGNYDFGMLYGMGSAAAFFASNADTGLVLDYHQANAGVSSFRAFLSAASGVVRSMTMAGGQAGTTGAASDTMHVQSTWRDTASVITSLVVGIKGGTAEIGIGSHFELWAPRTF